MRIVPNGYYPLKDFPDYCINEKGDVYNIKLSKHVSGCVNPDGYHNYRLKRSDGHYLTIGRHRLLAMCFIECDGGWESYTVNHINGIKGDDRIENLEWCTYRDNLKKAAEMGLTEKMKKVWVYVKKTDKVYSFDSYKEAALMFRQGKDVVSYWVKNCQNKYLINGRCYFSEEPTKAKIKALEVGEFGKSREIFCLDLSSRKIKCFPSANDASRHIGLSPAIISIRSKPLSRVYMNRYVLSDTLETLEKIDVKKLIESTLLESKAVVIVGEEKVDVFFSAASAASKLNIGKGLFHYRLNSNSYPNYMRYSDFRMVRYDGDVIVNFS